MSILVTDRHQVQWQFSEGTEWSHTQDGCLVILGKTEILAKFNAECWAVVERAE